MRTSKRTPDGTEIIAREPALGEHPHPSQEKRLVPFNGVTKVLLADGRELFECDRCGKLFDSTKQTASHSASAHSVTDKRSTSVETIKTVLRVMHQERAKAKAEGRRSFQQEAADELNRRGVKPFRGGEWAATTVNAIWQKYRDVYKVRVRTTVSRTVAAAEATAAVLDKPAKRSTKKPTEIDDHALFSMIMNDLKHLRDTADRIETHVIAAEDRMRQRPLVDLDDKALRALESLRRALQSS